MDWLSLIPAGLSFLSGILGGGSNTNKTSSSSSTTLTPAMQALANQVMTGAETQYNKPYTPYTGQRVAGPTAARTALTPVLQQIGSQTMGDMNDANGYRARIASLLNRGPGQVTAPSLLGGPQGGYARLPSPNPPVPINPTMPSVAAVPPPSVGSTTPGVH